MSIRISHQGMFNDGGLPFALSATGGIAGADLRVSVGAQATFPHYGKFAARTSTQGEIQLCDAGEIAVGVFAGLVTVGANGLAVKTGVAIPTAAELLSGVWQVDAIDTTNNKVLINVESRL
jgi:hypothetical protein